MLDHVFELGESGQWIERGRLRGRALRDTTSFIRHGPEHVDIHVPDRTHVDPHVREFIDYLCRDGVPAVFFIRISKDQSYCTLGSWVREIVEALAGDTSVSQIMTAISEDLDSLLGVESAHDRIEAHGRMEELLSEIQASLTMQHCA